MSENKTGSDLVVEYHVVKDEEGGGGLVNVYAIYDSEEAWTEHEVHDYMLDNFSYFLVQGGFLGKDRYTEQPIEANTTWLLSDKPLEPGCIVCDLRGERLTKDAEFYIQPSE